MNRVFACCALALLVLSACGKSSDVQTTSARFRGAAGGLQAMDAAAPAPPASEAAQAKTGEENAPKLAYTHSLSLEMAASKVKPRFEKARDLCLNTAEMHCALVHASIQLGNAQSSEPPSAELSVRLPHDQIAAFEKTLLAPLEGEEKGQPILTQSTTDAEDLTYAIQDGDRRLKQASDYRDRLMALAQHAGAKVEDLIQIEEKLSEVQSTIEELTAQQRQLNLRVDTEVLNVSLSATPTFANARSPLARAWDNAAEVLGENAAQAFTFIVGALPWLPIIAILIWILGWLLRLLRNRVWRRRHEGASKA